MSLSRFLNFAKQIPHINSVAVIFKRVNMIFFNLGAGKVNVVGSFLH